MYSELYMFDRKVERALSLIGRMGQTVAGPTKWTSEGFWEQMSVSGAAAIRLRVCKIHSAYMYIHTCHM